MNCATDYYVKMGSEHIVCQDYGIAGKTKGGNSWAAISDGCSAISNPKSPHHPPGFPYTDYGSRFVVRGAVIELDEAEGQDDFNVWHAFEHAAKAADQLGLPSDALDATLVMAYEQKALFQTAMYGDGVIVTLTRDNILSYLTVEFDQNAPYYLSYSKANGRRDAYHRICKSQTVTYRRRELDGTWQEPLTETVPIFGWGQHREYPKDNYKLVLVCSDGLKSFQDKSANLPLETVLDQLCTFKGLNGEFLTRRLNFFQKTCQDLGWRHYDDLSIAGLALP
jgi:hypothetical protein